MKASQALVIRDQGHRSFYDDCSGSVATFLCSIPVYQARSLASSRLVSSKRIYWWLLLVCSSRQPLIITVTRSEVKVTFGIKFSKPGWPSVREYRSLPSVREYRPLIPYMQSEFCRHIDNGHTPPTCEGHSPFRLISPPMTRMG